MKIDIEDIRSAINRVLDHLVVGGTKEIDIEENFYWQLLGEQAFDMNLTKEQIELAIGSLSDDWEFTKSLLNKDATPVPYQLTEIEPLIYAIGHIAAKKGIF